MSNLQTWMMSKGSFKEDKDFAGIAYCFKMASMQAVAGISIDDANYVEEEIFELASKGNVEEIISNYFIAKHGFDPFFS